MDLPLYGLIVTNEIVDDQRSFHGLPKLNWCNTDGKRIERALIEHRIGDAKFDSIVNENRDAVYAALTRFFADEDENLRFFYFAGHGYRDDYGNLFLLMRDSKKKDLLGTALSAVNINEIVAQSPARRKIIVLDCCFGAALFSRIRAGKEIHLDKVIQGQGTVLIASSSESEYARDDRESFTSFLVQGLETGKADKDLDGYVSLEEWFDYASQKVADYQTPKMVYYDRTSPIYIALSPRSSAVRKDNIEPSIEPVVESKPAQPTGGIPMRPKNPNENPLASIRTNTLVAKVRMMPPSSLYNSPKLLLSIRNFDTRETEIARITCRTDNIPNEEGLYGNYPLSPGQQIDLVLPDDLLNAQNGIIMVYISSVNGTVNLGCIANIPNDYTPFPDQDSTRHDLDQDNPDDGDLHDGSIRPPKRTDPGPFNRR